MGRIYLAEAHGFCKAKEPPLQTAQAAETRPRARPASMWKGAFWPCCMAPHALTSFSPPEGVSHPIWFVEESVCWFQLFGGSCTGPRLPRGFRGKEPACKAGVAGDTGSIPGSGRSPGEGHGNLLQYSCLENTMDRKAWWATGHRAAKSQVTEVT